METRLSFDFTILPTKMKGMESSGIRVSSQPGQ